MGLIRKTNCTTAYKLAFYGVLKIDLPCWDISNGYSTGSKDFGRKKNRWRAGGVGHGSKDGIRPIILRFSQSNHFGGHIYCCDLRVGCLFSNDFCAHHENQTDRSC